MTKRERRSNAGSKTVGRPHSIKSEEVAMWFQVWGIVGKRPHRGRVMNKFPKQHFRRMSDE